MITRENAIIRKNTGADYCLLKCARDEQVVYSLSPSIVGGREGAFRVLNREDVNEPTR